MVTANGALRVKTGRGRVEIEGDAAGLYALELVLRVARREGSYHMSDRGWRIVALRDGPDVPYLENRIREGTA